MPSNNFMLWAWRCLYQVFAALQTVRRTASYMAMPLVSSCDSFGFKEEQFSLVSLEQHTVLNSEVLFDFGAEVL